MCKENAFIAINRDPYPLAKKDISEDCNLVGMKLLRTTVSAGDGLGWKETPTIEITLL